MIVTHEDEVLAHLVTLTRRYYLAVNVVCDIIGSVVVLNYDVNIRIDRSREDTHHTQQIKLQVLLRRSHSVE